MLEIIKKLAWSISAGGYSYFLVGAIWAAAGGYAVYLVEELRINAAVARAEAAEARAEQAEQRERGTKVDLAACSAAAEQQNQAIHDLKKRAEQAEQAMHQADEARAKAEDRANQILRERVPAGADRCEAARKAFSEELRQERGL